MEYKLKDSGERQVFNTGAQRDMAFGKGKYQLVSPIAIKRVSDILEKGAKKYNPRNWELGMPLSRFVDSAFRHLYQYLEGKRDEDHAGQALFNLMALLHTEEQISRGNLPSELMDLPCYINEKDMDESTKFWWGNMRKITQSKSKTEKLSK